jgi:hypothetical protein
LEEVTGIQAGMQVQDIHAGGSEPPQGFVGGLVIKRARLWGTGDNPWE